MALAKGHSSKTKSQVSDIKTIGPLVFDVATTIVKLNVASIFCGTSPSNWIKWHLHMQQYQ